MREEICDLDRMRQVASDRLVFVRVLEKAVNDIQGVLANLASDVSEISNAVAQRNADLSATPLEEDLEDESDD